MDAAINWVGVINSPPTKRTKNGGLWNGKWFLRRLVIECIAYSLAGTVSGNY